MSATHIASYNTQLPNMNKRHNSNNDIFVSSSNSSLYGTMSNGTSPSNGKPPRNISNGRVSPNRLPKHKDGGSINLKTVERIDSGVCEIIETVSCVVVYEYLDHSESWERSSMEGTLFVYSRDSSVSPGSSNAFVILSKLTNENLHLHLDGNTMIHTQCPFVLFRRSSTDKVYGLNFTDDETCKRVGKDLSRLCQNSRHVLSSKNKEQQQTLSITNKRNQSTPSPSLSDCSGGESQEEIGSTEASVRQRKDLVSKQRQSTNREPIVITQSSKQRRKRETSPLSTSRSSSRNNNKSTGPAHPPSSTPKIDKSVGRSKDILINARQQSNSFDAGHEHKSLDSVSLSNPVKKLLFHSKTFDVDVPSDTPPVLHDLFASASSQVITTPTYGQGVYSTPPKKMVSVTELEQHMSNTDTPASNSSPAPSHPRLLHPSAFSNSSPFMTDQSDSNDNKPDVNILPPTPVSVHASPILIGAKFPSIPSLVQSPGMRSHPIVTDHHQPVVTQSITTQSVSTNQIAVVNDTPLNTSSTLMSPQVFLGVNRSASEPTKTKTEATIGLTEPQLQQALIHLIKNDAGFITTLHEAYVNSLKSSTR